MLFRSLLTVLATFGLLAAAPIGVSLFVPAPAAAQQPMAAPIVKSIDVQYAGASTVAKEKILANMKTRVGRPYDERTVEDDIRSLFATGNVANVRIFGEPEGDGVRVIVVIQAKSQITEVRLVGVTKLKESRVRKEISTKPGDPLNEANLEADRQKVLEYYRGKGFTQTDAQFDVDVNEQAATAIVTFTVNEGDKVSIRKVVFEGNQNIKAGDIRKVVKTRPKGILNFFTSAGRIDAEQLEIDAQGIRDLYQSRGYIDVEVAQPRVDRLNGKADIVFTITEGPQYKVGNVTYTGVNVFGMDELTKNLKIKTGAVYSPQGVRDDIRAIQDLYGSRGYIDFAAGAQTAPGGAQTIDVAFTVEEGTQSYVEHINISGNTRTKDKVIRREIAVSPGDVYNTVRVDASRRRLIGLNYFSKVDMYPQDTLVPGRKDLNVIVEEKRTGSFNFGAGFSSIDSLLGFVEITQGNFDVTRWPNFTGGGQKFRFRAQYGVRRRDFIIALTEPYFMDYKLSLGGEVFYRDASFVSDVYDERRYGFDINARTAINDFSYVRFGYRLENIGIHNLDDDVSQIIKDEEGDRLKSQIYAGLTWDTRDDYFLTRRGHRVDVNGFIAGGFLGGDTQIYGADIQATKYILLPWDTILILQGELAYVETWGSGDRVPIYDRLYLGGANNLRGFRYRDVGPKDEDGEPIGGTSLARFTVEYTFPIAEKVRGAVFYDGGMVDSGYNSDAGIGLRLDLPIGPIRIDYGIPIQSDEHNGGSGKFNFNIGYQF